MLLQFSSLVKLFLLWLTVELGCGVGVVLGVGVGCGWVDVGCVVLKLMHGFEGMVHRWYCIVFIGVDRFSCWLRLW